MINNMEEKAAVVMGAKLNSTGCTSPASISVRSNQLVSSGQRMTVVVLGSCVNAGYKYWISIYGRAITVTAVLGDTEYSIRVKLANAINSYNSWGINVPIKPMAVVGSDHLKVITESSVNITIGASGSYVAPVQSAPLSSINPYQVTAPNTATSSTALQPGSTQITQPLSGSPDPLQPVSSVQQLFSQPVVNEYATNEFAAPQQLGGPVSSSSVVAGEAPASYQAPAIDLLFPAPYMPYSAGGGGGGGSADTPETTVLVPVPRQHPKYYFWVLAGCMSLAGYILFNPKNSIGTL